MIKYLEVIVYTGNIEEKKLLIKYTLIYQYTNNIFNDDIWENEFLLK